MPRYFFDSSAIFKRYYREMGTDWVRAICESRTRPLLYLSQIAHVEVVAALRRTERLNKEQPAYINALVNEFTRQIGRRGYQIVPVAPAVALAVALCNRYGQINPGPLRSLDAIQLASALLVAPRAPDDLMLVTGDIRMAAVAAFEGLRVINPTYPPTPRT